MSKVSTTVSDTETEKPPDHPFEVRVTIGGNNWKYVARTLHYLADTVSTHDIDSNILRLASGGWDGSYDLAVDKRDVTADQYREELQLWWERQSCPHTA